MSESREGSTAQLIEFCAAYFFLYVVYGVAVKYFEGPAAQGLPGMDQTEFTVYSTLGGTLVCLVVVLSLGWFRLHSNQHMNVAGKSVPRELLYIVPSGICTAVVIPTTTLMYSLPISVMVAMVIMRGSVIVIGRVVDAVQIKQGILQKNVYWQEDIAVVFALLAVGANLFFANTAGGFEFIHNAAAVAILSFYVLAYGLRIYIMNYFKNTRGKGVKQDNKGFFAIEQISASISMVLVAVVLFHGQQWFGWTSKQAVAFHTSLTELRPWWGGGMLAGMVYGAGAFFSVFIFMFKGRTATFAGLVNRLTSLVAGTMATLASWLLFKGKLPTMEDWVSLGFILVAVAFLTKAERRRAAELATHAVAMAPKAA